MNFESLLYEVQPSDGLLIIVLSYLDVFELDIKLEIHLTASQKEVYRQIYRLILVMTCDIETAQDTQAPELGKELPKSTFELRSTVPGLKAESGNLLDTGGKISCIGPSQYVLDGPDSPKCAFKKAAWKQLSNLSPY